MVVRQDGSKNKEGATGNGRRGNLPTALSSFVGRKREIVEVKALLTAHRLLTLTGPGGCGKTRLALQVAGDLSAIYAGGAWMIDLSPLADGRLVPQVAASALGLGQQSAQKAGELLQHHLQSASALLLFDNCEHLVDACAALCATLMASCPNLRILATSREPLAVPGERIWLVPPLSLPERQPWRDPFGQKQALSAYGQSEAVQLFVERASAASPGFSLTAENGVWIAEICRRLDGIPLAIELAAARVRAFSARQIVQRLDNRFQLLSKGWRTAPARQQTLVATLDWSYDLLSEEEQAILLCLSVFTGGWTLEAAEAVCAGDSADARNVPELLSNLVDKSLVVVERLPGRRRYRLLETVRQYAQQKLGEAGELAGLRDRHLEHFTTWAEMAANHLTGPEQENWLARFEQEHDNLRAALDWSQSSAGRGHAGLRLAVACGYFWRLRGYLSEGRERLGRALAQEGAEGISQARVRALRRAAHLAYLQSDYAACSRLAQAALDAGRKLGAGGRIELARALDLLGKVAIETGDYDQASEHLAGALQIYQEMNYARGIANTLMQLGGCAMRSGDYEKANSYLAQSLDFLRDLPERFLTASVLSTLGELALRRDRYDLAAERLQESLSLRRSLDDRLGIAAALGSLAWAALLQADYQHMRQLLRESLTIRMEIGDQGGIAWCLEKAAEGLIQEAALLPAALRKQTAARAARIIAAAAALRAPINSVVDSADRPAYEQTLEALRADLGPETFAAAWDGGSALSLAEVVDQALTPALTPANAASLSQAAADKVKYGGLSPRERQTAALIAQGKTNRAIAETMVVREKTIETYVTRILNKLGFDSRVQIATWAIEVELPAAEQGDA